MARGITERIAHLACKILDLPVGGLTIGGDKVTRTAEQINNASGGGGSPMVLANDPDTTAGLDYGYKGGFFRRFVPSLDYIEVEDDIITLADATTNYVFFDISDETVKVRQAEVDTTGNDHFLMAIVTTAGGVIADQVDLASARYSPSLMSGDGTRDLSIVGGGPSPLTLHFQQISVVMPDGSIANLPTSSSFNCPANLDFYLHIDRTGAFVPNVSRDPELFCLYSISTNGTVITAKNDLRSMLQFGQWLNGPQFSKSYYKKVVTPGDPDVFFLGGELQARLRTIGQGTIQANVSYGIATSMTRRVTYDVQDDPGDRIVLKSFDLPFTQASPNYSITLESPSNGDAVFIGGVPTEFTNGIVFDEPGNGTITLDGSRRCNQNILLPTPPDELTITPMLGILNIQTSGSGTEHKINLTSPEFDNFPQLIRIFCTLIDPGDVVTLNVTDPEIYWNGHAVGSIRFTEVGSEITIARHGPYAWDLLGWSDDDDVEVVLFNNEPDESLSFFDDFHGINTVAVKGSTDSDDADRVDFGWVKDVTTGAAVASVDVFGNGMVPQTALGLSINDDNAARSATLVSAKLFGAAQKSVLEFALINEAALLSGVNLALGFGKRTATDDPAVYFSTSGSGAVTCQVAGGASAAAGVTIINSTLFVFKIDATDITDIKFYINDARVAGGTTFSCASDAFNAALFRTSKASGTNVSTIWLDWVKEFGQRVAVPLYG